jgi:hypothetical protein
MSTSGPFDTGYVGAHRWHVECPQGAYVWTCVCGDTGRVAGNLAFCQEAFARHAHDRLQEAAVSLLTAYMGNLSYRQLQDEVGHLRRAEDNDQANLLQLVANHRYDQES